ncbi:hypothetical protein SmJEL517_g03746 [Synchytrium microbalum]|uniref:Alpha-1,3-glucosyltransferase n=1 Tax=Synchytrium microbalum TaxID=1806994 RepID=A0A507C2W5_9FUNG|nr:uncharacterized protein SmJEL517_g03746 [Synchytrium microbalum]TPX33389.1 hypothetical protein SmJEL517_g03746 [Synchytrium microbalum]
MLKLENLNYASPATVIFQRLTVMMTESILFLAAWRFAKHSNRHVLIQLALIFLNPGLMIVDNIHFQYNGFLYGLLVFSIDSILEGNVLIGAAAFTIMLNMKHIFLYIAPAYFVYLLRQYCFTQQGSFSIQRFISLGMVVLSVFMVSFGPFYDQLPQILSRLFPFKRGLCHAYWAPNFWALYAFADRVLVRVAKLLGLLWIKELPTLTRGLVGDVSFGVLPNITPLHTLIATVLSQVPSIIRVWQSPTPDEFIHSITMCAFGSFMFGWHVHEKAILLGIVPFSLIATKSEKHARLFYLLSIAGSFSLFPLLFKAAEGPIKLCLLALFAMLGYHALGRYTSAFCCISFMCRHNSATSS